MDLYWIAHGSKLTPHQWFEKYPGRFVMWHVKDMHRTSRDYTELGNGTIDFTKIWPDASLAGLKHFFVEQGGNFTHDPFTSVADSAWVARQERALEIERLPGRLCQADVTTPHVDVPVISGPG